MYTWLLIAGGILAVGLALKNLVFGRKSPKIPRMSVLRPQLSGTDAAGPELSRSERSGESQTVNSPLSALAAGGQTSRFSENVPRSAAEIPAGAARDSGSGSFIHAGTTAFSSAHSESLGISGKTNRISTWNDRRLFEDFRGILGNNAEALSRPAPEELPIRNDEMLFGGLTPAIAQMLPETQSRKEVQWKALQGAGYHSRASWLNLTALRFSLAFISLVIIGFWLNVAPRQFEIPLMALVIIAPLVMWALPPLIVSMKATERKIDIERGLPDVLDMLNMGVSQGLTVPQSLSRISREIAPAHPALAEELQIVDRQAQVGSLYQALKNFGQRIDSPEVASFTTLITQSEATGTSISDSLTQYSDSIRSTLKERADARANAASFKLLFPVSLCLMPSVFLFLLGPAIVEMSDFFGNRAGALNADRDNALESLRQQPRIDYSRFQQIEN